MQSIQRAVIFANGELNDLPAARSVLAPGDTLVAADGGSKHLARLGLLPALVIGDLDSLSSAEVEALALQGVRILRHPTHKDETDLELAVLHMVQEGFQSIRIMGGLGGRLDQTLANLYLMTDPRWQGVDLRLDDGRVEAFVIRQSASVHGSHGDIVSLIPLQGEARGVRTESLEYPLLGETLYPYRTRGISNVMQTAEAVIHVESGLLLGVHTRG